MTNDTTAPSASITVPQLVVEDRQLGTGHLSTPIRWNADRTVLTVYTAARSGGVATGQARPTYTLSLDPLSDEADSDDPEWTVHRVRVIETRLERPGVNEHIATIEWFGSGGWRVDRLASGDLTDRMGYGTPAAAVESLIRSPIVV